MHERQIRSDRVPKHVAIIMDGNGRWALARGLERSAGHREAIESVRDTVQAASDIGIDCLTLYAFSNENWNRPKEEVAELMRLLEEFLVIEIDEVMRNGIRIRTIGRLDRLPPSTRKAVDSAVEQTKDNRRMTLVFALSYGGRTELVDATRRLMRAAQSGEIDPTHLDEETFAKHLYLPEVGDPDLLIRTGGESRISNFLLWQIAYTEIYTTDVMWPEFRRKHLVDAILDYQSRERRFGLTSAQVEGDDDGPAGALDATSPAGQAGGERS
jgi:undecaprenyl diphosphate synthase